MVSLTKRKDLKFLQKIVRKWGHLAKAQSLQRKIKESPSEMKG
jgi:hypothetical protein